MRTTILASPKKSFLQRFFQIYPGEEKNAFLFAALGFFWAFGATCGLKFADALFLLHVGAERLPEAYTLTACGMLVVASLLLFAFHYFSSFTIFRIVLVTGLSFYTIVFLCLLAGIGLESIWLWFALKIAGFFMFSVLMTCYWTFIDQYHHLQDAKRLYSLFSSTIFLGAASTGLVMRSGTLNLTGLVLWVIGLFCLTYYWVGKIARDVPFVIHEDSEPEGSATETSNSFKLLLQAVLHSPFTLLLMTSNFITQLLLVITEYSYMSTFEQYFSNQPNANVGEGTEADLTLFLGQSLATVSVANLIIGLFIYSRLIRRFGISSLLMVTPILLIVSFSGWSLSPSLIFPLIGFFVVEGTLYVIDDSNFNLLLNAVPSKLKYKIRVMIESFFEPVGMLVSATLLTFLQQRSRWLGLALAACSLLVALALRSQYVKALFSNLAENAIHFHRNLTNWVERLTPKQQVTAQHKLLSILKTGDEQSQLFASEILLAYEDRVLLQQLLEQASDWPIATKIKLIPLLEHSSFVKENSVIDTLHVWSQQHFDIDLKSAIHFYLAKQGLLHPEKIVADLNSPHIQLQGAAIIALKTSLASLPPTTAAANRALASQSVNFLLASEKEDDICMGLHILGIEGESSDVDILISYLRHPSLNIARTAAQSMAQADSINSIQQAPLIISHLTNVTDNEIRLACLKALGKVNDSTLVSQIIQTSAHFRPSERRLTEAIISQMGLKTVPTLLALTKDISMPDRCRVLAGRILGHLSLPQLRANLSEIIRQEIERAYFYFFYSHTIQSNYPHLDLKMLSDVLMTGYHSVINFIIQLLGVSGEIEDAELLSRSIRSRNPKVRSQVVEALEKTAETPIFRLMQPLVDELPHQEKIQAYLNLKRKSLSLTDLLDTMTQSSSQIDRIIAATIKHQLNVPNWRESLRQQMLQHDEIFHHFAYELLDA